MRKVGQSFSRKFSKSEIKQAVASPSSASVTATKVFGVRLDLTQTELPKVLKMAIDYFEVKGYEYEGLFRLSGNMNTIQDLISKIDNCDSFDILTVSDPHVVAGLLKQYFLLLPEPVLTYELHDVFLAATMVAKQKGQLDPLKKALSFLAPQSFRVLKALVGLLSRTSEFSEKNKMSPVNLAIAFSPSLVRSESEGGLEATMKEMTRSNSLLELLIIHYNHFFDVPAAGIKELTQDLLPSPPSTAPISKGDTPALNHTLKIEPSVWRFNPQSSQENAYKTLDEALGAFFKLVIAARDHGNLAMNAFCDESVVSLQNRLLKVLPAFQKYALRSSGLQQTHSNAVSVFPHSFFVTSKGKIGMLFSGWPQAILSFKNAIDENASLVPRSVRCPKLIFAITNTEASKDELKKIALICKEANQKLLTRLQKAVPYLITRIALVMHQRRRSHTYPAVLKLSDDASSQEESLAPSSTVPPYFAKCCVDMKSALYQSTAEIMSPQVHNAQDVWKVSLVQFLERQMLRELFDDFRKFVNDKMGRLKSTSIEWVPDESTAMIIHTLNHEPRSPLQGCLSNFEYVATGLSSLSPEQQSNLLCWISRLNEGRFD